MEFVVEVSQSSQAWLIRSEPALQILAFGQCPANLRRRSLKEGKYRDNFEQEKVNQCNFSRIRNQ